MSDPRRWLEGGAGLDALERRVLRAGADVKPPSGAKAAVWAAVTAETTLAAGSAAAGVGAGSAAGGLGGMVAKSLGLGALAAVGLLSVVQGVRALQSPADPRRLVPSTALEAVLRPPSGPPAAALAKSEAAPADAPHTVPLAAPPLAREGTRSEAVEVPMPVAKQGSTAAFEPPVSEARPEATFRREVQAMARARAILRGGDAATALTALQELEREFPRGLLTQERDALTIEALQTLGQLDAARSRAKTFLLRYPGSPHSGSAQRVLQP